MFRLMLAIGLALMGAGLVRGDPPPGVKPIRVDLHPSPPPAAALKYALLPHLQDLKPGNALADYRTAMMSMKEAVRALDDPLWNDRIDKWNRIAPPAPTVRAGACFPEAVGTEPETRRGSLPPRVDGLGIDRENSQARNRHSSAGAFWRDGVCLLFGAAYSAGAGRGSHEGRPSRPANDDGHRAAHEPVPGLIGALVGVAIASKTAAEVDHWIQHPQRRTCTGP